MCVRFDDITPASLVTAQTKFYALQRETTRKRMAADVEIKLRSIYFDRIERSMVEDVLNAIYEHVIELEDVEFLVKYASQ